jgi:hypothetical protein
MGRNKILSGDCFTVVQDFDAIVDQMTVPLIQGMLKYAFKSDPANAQGSCTSGSCDKAWAEGWAFAAAVLPRLHYCSFEIADMVRRNLDTANAAPMKDGFGQLKAQVESTYPCLGITCADVGAFQTSAGIYEGMDACTDPQGGPAPADLCPAPETTAAPTTAATSPPVTSAPTTAATSAPTTATTSAPDDDDDATTTEEPKKVVDLDDTESYVFGALSAIVFVLYV